MNKIDKSLLFFIVSLTSLWLVLDYIWGEKYVGKFVVAIVPSAEKGSIIRGKKSKDKDEDETDEDEGDE